MSKPTPKPNVRAAITHCEKQIQRHSASTRETMGRIKIVLREVVAKSFERGKLGFVLTEGHLQELLDCSKRTAKRLKEKMKAFGLIVCLKRAEREGEVAVWALRHEFIKWPPRKSKRAPRSLSRLIYTPEYYRMRKLLIKELAAELRDSERPLTPGEFNTCVAINLRDKLAIQGLTKEDFLRPPPTPTPLTPRFDVVGGPFVTVKAVA